MDRAIENCAIGKHRIVMARNIEKVYLGTISFNNKRFICPDCGEYVTFVRGHKHKSHFKHCKSNSDTEFCELRSKYQQDCSIYEKVGLPLYLKKCADNKFELYILFYCIDEAFVNIAKKDKFKVTISSSHNNFFVQYYVDDNNFFRNSSTLKKINFISQSYNINYSSTKAQKLLSVKWGKYAEGISKYGALFMYNESGGRKIKINDDITTNTDYFYLCTNNVLCKCDGVNHNYCGEMSIKSDLVDQKYFIYKIKFKPNNENQFERLYYFCREMFKVSLIYNPSSLIEIWPPAISRDNEISYIKEESKALFILNSEVNSKIFKHRSLLTEEFNGLILDENKYLVEVPIDKNNVAVSINEKYNSICLFLDTYKRKIKRYSNNIYITDINGIIYNSISSKLPYDRTIKVVSSSKCYILYFKKNKLYKYYIINTQEGITINNIDFNDKIICISGIRKIKSLEFIKENVDNICNSDDKSLYYILSKLGPPFINTPNWIKSLFIIEKNNIRTFKLIKKFINSNRMPARATKILMNLYLHKKDCIKDEK